MILLVHPKIRDWAPPNNLPLGLAYTAAGLKRGGALYEVFDDNVLRWSDDRIRAMLEERKPEVVGITAICHQYAQVKRWCGLISLALPGCRVILGGPLTEVGWNLNFYLGKPQIFYGESEQEFPRLVGDAVWREYSAPAIKDLDSLPWPDWDSFSMIEYAQNPVGFINTRKWSDGRAAGNVPRSMNLLATRGCPNRCTFCATNFKGQAYRKRSPYLVINEMAELKRRYNVEYFHLSDDNTTADRRWIGVFCDLFSRALPGCSWGCASRVDTIDEDVLRHMKDSGCLGVGLGVESGSQQILNTLKKGVTVEQNVEAILASKKVFGAANYSMMVGSPGETMETVQESIALCFRTETRPETVFFTTPIPGSDLYREAREKELIVDEEAYLMSLGENNKQIACNVSGQEDDWLRVAQATIEDETKQFGGAI